MKKYSTSLDVSNQILGFIGIETTGALFIAALFMLLYGENVVPDWQNAGLLFLNSVLTFVFNYAFVSSVVLLTPTLSAIGVSLSIPVVSVIQLIRGKPLNYIEYIGVGIVCISVTGFSMTENSADTDTEPLLEDTE